MRITRSLASAVPVLGAGIALISLPISGFERKPAADRDFISKSECLRGDARAKTYYGPAILQLARDLEDFYVFTPVGAWYALKLRRNLEIGLYCGIIDPAEVSKRLTDDLQAVSADLQLRVQPVQPAPGAQGLSPPNAIEGAKWIAPGVAYIRFNLFPGTPETIASTEKFMREHVTARAIIIDGRENHGGGAEEMNVMLPYFYASPTKLMEMEASRKVVKAQGFPVSEDTFFHRVKSPPGMVRFEHLVTPNPSEHRLFKAKVFYLTSTAGTGSAGEVLAFALKLTHRGTLVGEHTRGMDHFGNFLPLGEGLEVFLPMGRTFDPVTGNDWEGAGVLPDVSTPADKALDVALKLAQE
jgi:peptidase S41-like protein